VTQSPSPTPEETFAATSVPNGCGGDVEQPIFNTGPLPAQTHLRILVGDRDLLLVDVDAGRSTRVATRPGRTPITQLAANGSQVVAVLRDPCHAEGYGRGQVGVVDLRTGKIRTTGRGDVLLPGAPLTALVNDPAGNASVRDLTSTRTVPLPPRWFPQARTASGFFASVSGAGADSGGPPDVGIGDPARATLTKTFGAGNVVAASSSALYWLAGDCPGPHCLLTWTTPDGTNTAQSLDRNAWGGEVSPDGSKVAFRLQRESGRFGEHPGPPNDIAVLDTTGDGAPLTVLPGVLLPAKAGLTLTWSPDSSWLVIGTDLGSGDGILIWQPGMDRPAQVPVPATVGGTTGPPALLVLPSA
jgi:hypothetical protein